ncbi:23S rRNA accumulation protein YceD [Gammaproteobacteria bacterium]
MRKSWPELIDPFRLADQEREIRGTYPLAKLDRLIPSLHSPEGEVVFALHFGRDLESKPVIHGQVTTKLSLICQRCLTPMWFLIDCPVFLGIVQSMSEADRLPEEAEPLLVTETLVSIQELIEDELILALPIVATHEMEECPARETLEGITPNFGEVSLN